MDTRKDVKSSHWPSFTDEEIDKVRDVLRSNQVNYWTGREGRDFEKEFAAWCGCEYAVAVANGTVALDLALKAAGIGEGDEVVVTPRTFLASVSSVVNAGAKPVFADVDFNSQNIEAHSIAKVITSKTKAVIVVHLAGMPAEMDQIMRLSQKHHLTVIEDCAQAHGATYKGRSVGSIGHIGCWSFCQDKIMSTGGEGGMVTTNSQAYWSAMWSYKDHGKSWEAVYEREHAPGFRWLHESFGTNWRMTEMQAAIGRVQLGRMKDWTFLRQRNSYAIDSVCKKFPALRVPEIPEYMEHARYRCYVFVKPERLKQGWDRDRIVHFLNQKGVSCMQGSCSEVYLEKAFDNTGFRPEERLPVARNIGETSIMFLVHPTLSDVELSLICKAIEDVMSICSVH